MSTDTVLTDDQISDETRKLFGSLPTDQEMRLARAIEQAVLQSPEIQRLKAIETAAGEVLSMPREDGYIVLTVHLDALRAAMEKQT